MKANKKETALKTSKEVLKDTIITSIQDKQGEDIISLDLTNVQDSVTDYFIVCHATSTTQVKAIADNVIKKVKDELGEQAWHKEGLTNLEWVLIDFVNIVVHVFKKEAREFYQIEDLWGDAVATEYES